MSCLKQAATCECPCSLWLKSTYLDHVLGNVKLRIDGWTIDCQIDVALCQSNILQEQQLLLRKVSATVLQVVSSSSCKMRAHP